MAGGITPISQPVDNFVGMVFKGYYRDYYDTYMLSAAENDKGHPSMPSSQLCAQWVVKAWNKVSENLIRKAWIVCGYKSVSDLENVEGSINIVAKYSRAE